MVKVVQEAILSKQPALRTAVVPIPTLHITLAVAYLPDMEHIGRLAFQQNIMFEDSFYVT
jgi:hypothetical protein